MSEINFHPNAHIPSMRNKKSGLKARTEILNTMSDTPISLKKLRELTKLSSSSLSYHLKLLEKHQFIQKKQLSKREVNVELTGRGQKIIQNYVK